MTEAEKRLSEAQMARIPVRVSVELGQSSRPLDEAVSLGAGAVVELNRTPDAPVDIFVDGFLYASGRVVTVNGDWAVRIEQLRTGAQAHA
jgi:flagellar motor switch protein FliN/FliY